MLTFPRKFQHDKMSASEILMGILIVTYHFLLAVISKVAVTFM
jgi:hypothetical protein